VCFSSIAEGEPAFYRVQIKDHKLERVASLKDVKRPTSGSFGSSSLSIYFEGCELTRSWQRMVIALLRSALEVGEVKSALTRVDVEGLLQKEEKRTWHRTHVKAEKKEHFLCYGGRPPITERRILGITDGFVRTRRLSRKY
jgi:hypothetical protein